jgi:hypothetical protein
MPSFNIRTLSLYAAVAAAIASPAAAEEWSRPTLHGGELTRSVTSEGGGVYSGTTTRSGANGGTYSSSTTCANGVVARCSRSYSGVSAAGKSFSGERLSAYGPFRARSVGSFTGPNGNTAYGFRRFRR